jgi:hypothetical protein
MWEGFWEAVVTEIKKVSGLDDSNVMYTIRHGVPKDLQVLVTAPDMSQEVQDSAGGSYYYLTCDVYVFARDADHKDAVKEAMAYACAIWVQIEDDRELLGEVGVTEDPEWLVDPPPIPGFERHLVAIRLRGQKWLDSP